MPKQFLGTFYGKTQIELPAIIKNKTKKIFDMIGINTGSVDYIVNTTGDFIFLEINPVGQYGMTDYPCNFELDYRIANYLTNGRN